MISGEESDAGRRSLNKILTKIKSDRVRIDIAKTMTLYNKLLANWLDRNEQIVNLIDRGIESSRAMEEFDTVKSDNERLRREMTRRKTLRDVVENLGDLSEEEEEEEEEKKTETEKKGVIISEIIDSSERKRWDDQIDKMKREIDQTYIPHLLEEKEKDKEITEFYEMLTEGNGKGDKGLTNFQIDKMMAKYPEFLGTISCDQIDDMILPHIDEGNQKGGFVMNLDKSGEPGSHWVGVYFDALKDFEINYFDSFADPPTKKTLDGIKHIDDALDSKYYLKFKENMIQRQNNNGSNCGYFAMAFLIDRFRGKPFIHASGYDDHIKSEKKIEEFKKQHGEGFGYIRGEGIGRSIRKGLKRVRKLAQLYDKTRDPIGAIAEHVIKKRGKIDPVKTFKDIIHISASASNNVRNLLNKHGNNIIKEIRVYRDPIQPMIESILDLSTLGEIRKKMNKLGYDQLYHLYAIMRLDNGTYWKIEKNARPDAVRMSGFADRKYINVPINSDKDVSSFWNGGIKVAGEHFFYRYDHITNNCQIWLSNLFKGSGWWNNELKDFILQDVFTLMKDKGILNRFTRAATDAKAIIDSALDKLDEGDEDEDEDEDDSAQNGGNYIPRTGNYIGPKIYAESGTLKHPLKRSRAIYM